MIPGAEPVAPFFGATSLVSGILAIGAYGAGHDWHDVEANLVATLVSIPTGGIGDERIVGLTVKGLARAYVRDGITGMIRWSGPEHEFTGASRVAAGVAAAHANSPNILSLILNMNPNQDPGASGWGW